ncbi:MAG: DUF3347 domain-containing protein [Daejeonella sp.]
MNNCKLIIPLTCFALFLGSCTQKNNRSNEVSSKKDSTKVSENRPVLKDTIMQKVYTHYNHLKNALVLSDSVEAKKAAHELALALTEIKGCETTGMVTRKIAGTEKLSEQRLHFIPVSADLIALFKHSEVSSGKLYVQYCPMANNGEGAYWLSSENQVKNPYYGDEMLDCGEVKEEIKGK